MSSSCMVRFQEGCTVVLHCGCAQSSRISPYSGDHSNESPLADCQWSLNQSPAARESHNASLSCGQKTSVGWSSPFWLWPSCWSGDSPSPELHVHFSDLSLRSHSHVAELVSSPYPPPTRGSVQAQD